eukprot:2110109-Rhodomonas_salina.1
MSGTDAGAVQRLSPMLLSVAYNLCAYDTTSTGIAYAATISLVLHLLCCYDPNSTGIAQAATFSLVLRRSAVLTWLCRYAVQHSIFVLILYMLLQSACTDTVCCYDLRSTDTAYAATEQQCRRAPGLLQSPASLPLHLLRTQCTHPRPETLVPRP